MSTVSGLEIANNVEREWRDRLDAALKVEREKVAAWMVQRGYATGHGDTIEDLLAELEWQVKEKVDSLERENFAWRTKLGVRGYELQIEDLKATIRSKS